MMTEEVGVPLPSADVCCVAGGTLHLGGTASLTGIRDPGLCRRGRARWLRGIGHGVRLIL